MGKGVLILLAAAILTSGYLLIDTRRAGLETEENQASYEHTLIAQQIAQSAFDRAVSQVQRDFDGYRSDTRLKQAYEGGDYDLRVTSTGPNQPVTVAVEGRFGGATTTMTGTLERRLDDFLDALTLDIDALNDPKGDNKMQIVGRDTPPPSLGGGILKIGQGYGPDAHAVKARIKSVRDLLASKFNHTRVYGAGGQGDFQTGAYDVDLHKLYDEALSYGPTTIYTKDKYDNTYFPPGVAHVFTNKKVEFKNVTFGAALAPAVIRVTGEEAVFDANTKGFGVLYVLTKKVEFKGDFRWEGLVLIDAVFEKQAEIKIPRAQIYGVMAVRRSEEPWNNDPNDKGLPGGHFDVDVFVAGKKGDMSKIYHQHQYDDKFDVTSIDLINPSGCKTGGGLCFAEHVKSKGYTEVRAEFFNAAASAGDYKVVAGGKTYTGDPKTGFNKKFDPATLTHFNVNFSTLGSLLASSPGKVQGDGSNRNGAFTVRLYEKDTMKLLYEVSVYEHAKDNAVVEGGEVATTTKFQPVKFEIQNDNTGIFYSTDALVRLAPLLDTVAKKIQPIVMDYRARTTDLGGRFNTE